jgi:endothelin-converting enzyme/putative endopeptidase
MTHCGLCFFSLVLCSALLFSQTKPAADLKFDIGAIDRSADPCSNFYQYACGGWLARNPIAADRSISAVFQQMRDRNQQRVTELLEQAAQVWQDRQSNARWQGGHPQAEHPDEQKIGDYYASCTDVKTIEGLGLDPLRVALDRIEATKNSDDLADAIARLHLLGSDALFATYSDQKLSDATEVIANLDQSQLNLPEPSYYLSGDPEMLKKREGYHAHLENEFTLLGESPRQAADAAEDVLRIETALARASLTPVERRDRKAWYHQMRLVDLQKLAPSFDWQRYFAAIAVDPRGDLNVAVPKYMQTVNDLVKKTPISAWKNYLRWELVRLSTPALPSRFRAAEFDFYSDALRGVKEQESRARQCEELTSRDLGEAIGKVYAERYFPPQTKQRVLDLVARLRQAAKEDFEEVSWMSAATRAEALKKLELLRAMIGYPDHWRDYASLEIQRGDALGNAFRGQQFEFRRVMAKIGKPVDHGEFYELVQGVEGYHDNPLNVIVFTAGILQPPFFDPRMDDAVNFGLAGAVIGHEISHAFDDKGHLFDGEGNMRDWWTPEDSKNYYNRAACFVRQYSNYTAVDDIKVNGELTLGENIADNGGLQLAWRAFQSLPARNAVPVDGYTPEQRFFLGWGQWRCTNFTEKRARELARTDGHSPGRWRVNGVVSNMSAFAQAYHCKAGEAMVNKDPCRIW